MINRIVFTLLLLLGLGEMAYATDPVPSAMLPALGNWTGQVGVGGGIPNVQTVFTNLTPGVSLSQISTALSNCPSNQVVQLAAGTYNLSGGITISKDGVVLRGTTNSSGVPTTTLNGFNIQINGGGTWDLSDSSKWSTVVNINSGATRGSSNIVTASSIGSAAVGKLMAIAAPGNPIISGGNWSIFLGTYPFVQLVEITAVAGTSISFWPPISADFLTNAVATVPTATTVHRAGVEDLYMTTSGGTASYYVELMGSDQCWANNIKTYDSQLYHMELYLSCRSEIRHCDMSHFETYSSGSYLVINIDSSSWYIEDNFFHDCPQVMPIFSGVGGVFSYNYITNCPYFQNWWLSQGVYYHGSFSCYNLFEGNYQPAMDCDGMGGGSDTGSRNTIYFRNRSRGFDGATHLGGGFNHNMYCFVLENTNANFVAVGNVLGQSGITSVYSGGPANDTYYVYRAASQSAPTRIDNWNVVDNGIHPGEGLSGGQALVNSYIYNSAPEFFGNLTWPPIDPATPSYSGSVTNIPAGYRSVFGVDPGGGLPAPSQLVISPSLTVSGAVIGGH